VALWREGLLAQHVLRGRTRGYRHHPQLERFRAQERPVGCLARYLAGVHAESRIRGYDFDRSKLARVGGDAVLDETDGQLMYEWEHLMRKLRARDPARHERLRRIAAPDVHPLFRITAGPIRSWERVSADKTASPRRGPGAR
jgi:hypothetical protein